MVDILHRVGIVSTVAEVYTAVTTQEGLAGWWTTDTKGSGDKVGDVLGFRFPAGGFDLEVVELTPDEHVRWTVVDGPPEWLGTYMDWRLHQSEEYAIVMFKHEGWREPVEFMHHCSTRWASFLLSLKSLVETGKGAPVPDDVPIGDWG